MKYLAIAMVLVAALFVSGAWAQPKHETELLPVVAGRGSTLWSIAEANIKYTDFKDIREYIYEIRKVNDLGRQGYIYPGQTIMVPVNKDK